MMLTADEIREMLLQMIVGAAGGDEAKWRDAIGGVEVLPLVMNAAGNWRLSSAKRTKREREVIDAAVKLLREEHPYAQVPEGAP